MSLVNVCFFALLLISESAGKTQRTKQRKIAIGVVVAMLGLNLGWSLK